MPRFKLIVMSNPVEGREDEYNDWYSNTHLRDVLRVVPGMVAAQRFRRTAAQAGNTAQPYEYLAIYECEADDVQIVIDGLKARAGTPDMPISSAMAEMRISCIFEPITERMVEH
jgi:hypothetical protein